MEVKFGSEGCGEHVLWGRAAEMLFPPWLPPKGPQQARGPWEEAFTRSLAQAVCGLGEGLLIFQILDPHLVMDHLLLPAKCLATALGMGTKDSNSTVWFDLNRL